MLKQLLKLVFMLAMLVNVPAWADENDATLYLDQTRLVSQQVLLLKDRLVQANKQLQLLEKQQDKPQINKTLMDQLQLANAVAKSNLDSINIELSESQQTISRLEKDIQERTNQLNVFNIFGLKIARNGAPDLNRMHLELNYQKTLLQTEKIRYTYLLRLQDTANTLLQFYRVKLNHLDNFIQTQTISHLKIQQAKSEINLQAQQSMWLRRLNLLNSQLITIPADAKNKALYEKLQTDIFYANENVNFIYLRMLIARYQEQIQQLAVSTAHNNSITLLNNSSEQVQALTKQLQQVELLIKERLDILSKRQMVSVNSKELQALALQYQNTITTLKNMNKSLVAFRFSIDQALQRALSARQGLPGLGAQDWVDLGGELLLVPTLTFQMLKSLTKAIVHSVSDLRTLNWIFILALQTFWFMLYGILNFVLKRMVLGMRDHEFGHINLRWLFIKIIHRNLLDIVVIGNFFWLLSLLEVPAQNFHFLINVALVLLFFKALIVMARLCLVETAHDKAGHDVRLYRQLKWIFLSGGFVTGLTVFMHQLPVIYEIKDLSERLFLLFLLIASVFLLKQWRLVPGLILPHIDDNHVYYKHVVRLLGVLIPLLLLVNSMMGLFGFVNLIFSISWYESIFLLVLVGYLVIRGLLNDAMEWMSKIFIQHVSNGWLVTEAFLKPLDRVLRIALFLTAWAVLFLLYGWDQQSPVVERLNKLLHYDVVNIFNTTITPISMIELAVIISFLYWAARWTREFVYRFLLSRTKDLGLRNSIAILSQYAMILIGIFICLRMLGIDFKALTFIATAFAFGAGLGLRDLINNFACGFLLLIERPLRVGDKVSINEHEGEVIHIGSRAITLRTSDHMEVLVPNTEIFSKSFTNWTSNDNIVRTVFSIKINRHDSPHDVQAIIQQVLSIHKNVLLDPGPEVYLKELADGLIEFEVRYFVNLQLVRSRTALRSQVLMAIWEAFERHGIQAPYPHHEIYVKGGMPVFSR